MRIGLGLAGLSLLGILALQMLICGSELGRPFLDTRLHYHFDNASFTTMARSGNRNGDLRSEFGVTANTYSAWGRRVGEPRYYTDHPFLVKTVFQQYTKIVGTDEWASRSFYLAVSFAVAAGAYVIFLATTGSFIASFVGAAILVSLPLFALYQTCVKFEMDGMLASVWVFVALLSWLRGGRPRSLVALGVATGLACLVHWTAILFAGVLGLWLLITSWRGREPRAGKAALVMGAGGVLGMGALLCLMSFLQRSWAGAREVLLEAFRTRAASIPLHAWWARQLAYARQNFTTAVLWLALAVLLVLLFLAARRWMSGSARSEAASPSPQSQPCRYLWLFFVSTLAVACAWLFGFRQGSFVHSYWQLWFCLPVATLAAGFLASLRGSPRIFAAATVAGCALVIFLLSASRTAYRGVFREELGTTDDVAFLRTLRDDPFDRMVFVPLTDSPFNQWFQGPLFEYYTDRPIAIAATGTEFRAGDKVLVLRAPQRDEVVTGLERVIDQKLAHEKCGRRLCAYDAIAAP